MSVIGTIILQENGTKVQFDIPQDKLTQIIDLIPREKKLEQISLMKSQKPKHDIIEKPKKRKTKKTKDPNAPKRPKSSFLLWVDKNRSQIKESLGEGHKQTEVMKEAGKQWRSLDASKKLPFEEEFKAQNERYKADLAEYKPTRTVESYSAEENSEAPEGWSGPYQLKYLWKHAGPDGKAMRFKDFDEAIKVAATIEDCGGITKTSRWYELRIGPDLMSVPEGKEQCGITSWIKESLTEPEEDEVEHIEVDEIVINGETYYKDAKNKLYDPLTGDEVGNLLA